MRNKTVNSVAFFFCALLVLGSGRGLAAAGEFPDNGVPTGWRVIAGDKSEVTSTCIGQMTSPLCVADTIMACGIWTYSDDYGAEVDDSWLGGYHPMCDPLRGRPGDEGLAPRNFGFENPNPRFHRVTYKLVAFRVTNENIYRVLRPDDDEKYNMMPGDLAVTFTAKSCGPNLECRLPKIKGQPTRYRADCPLDDCAMYDDPRTADAAILRRRDDGSWFVVEVFQPYRDNVWRFLEKFYRQMVW